MSNIIDLVAYRARKERDKLDAQTQRLWEAFINAPMADDRYSAWPPCEDTSHVYLITEDDDGA